MDEGRLAGLMRLEAGDIVTGSLEAAEVMEDTMMQFSPSTNLRPSQTLFLLGTPSV